MFILPSFFPDIVLILSCNVQGKFDLVKGSALILNSNYSSDSEIDTMGFI